MKYVLMFLLGPLASIAALNSLFGLNIDYNIGTYLAALWLGWVLW